MAIEDRFPLCPPPSNGEHVIDDVQAWMERKYAKPIAREDARQAADHLAAIGRLLVEWIHRADAADPTWRARAPRALTTVPKPETKE